MDFVSDQLSNGRRLKCLTVADDYSHEAVLISVDFSMPSPYVTRRLDQAVRFWGYPAAIRTDNGPEFTSRAFMAWTLVKGIRHFLTQPAAHAERLCRKLQLKVQGRVSERAPLL